MKYLCIQGCARDRGRQHGEQLRQEIAATVAFYNSQVFQGQHQLVRQLGLAYLKKLQAFNSDHATELLAIAEGAAQPDWQIAALNARTEIYHAVDNQPNNECTALYFPKTRLLGQNWDWIDGMQDLALVMEIRPEFGPNILQMTEPGIIGKIGLNSAGIGICLNILTGPPQPTAVPVHVLLRHLLTSSSIAELKQLLASFEPGSWSNLLIGTADGTHLDLEICGDQFEEVNYGDQAIVHTNHIISAFSNRANEDLDVKFASSAYRLQRGQHLAAHCSGQLSAFKSLLSDTEGVPLEIWRDYRETDGQVIGTIASIIMDLCSRTMHIRWGKHPEAGWQYFTLS